MKACPVRAQGSHDFEMGPSLEMGRAVILSSSQAMPPFLDTCAEMTPGEALGRLAPWAAPTR